MDRDTIADLERRLRYGETIIAATTDHNERTRLTDHWLQLLREYERAVDERRCRDERRAA